jgi:hypothetical protein
MKALRLLQELVCALIVLVIGGILVAGIWTVESEWPEPRRPIVRDAGPPIGEWEWGVVPRHNYEPPPDVPKRPT